LGLHHFRQTKPEGIGEPGAGDLEKTEVRDVADHAAAVGVEEHDINIGVDHGGQWATGVMEAKDGVSNKMDKLEQPDLGVSAETDKNETDARAFCMAD